MDREAAIRSLEAEGLEVVRARLADSKNYTPEYRAVAVEWVAQLDAQRVAASDASQALQAESASRAAKAAERAADAAERANTRATIANIIAALAVAMAALSLWISMNNNVSAP